MQGSARNSSGLRAHRRGGSTAARAAAAQAAATPAVAAGRGWARLGRGTGNGRCTLDVRARVNGTKGAHGRGAGLVGLRV